MVTRLAGPPLEVVVAAQRSVRRGVGDRLGELVGLGDHRPPTPDRPAERVGAVVGPGAGGGALATDRALEHRLEALLGGVGVLDLHDEHRGDAELGLVVLLPEVDGGDGEPVAEPGVDVVTPVEVGAGTGLLEPLEQRLAQAALAVGVDLAVEGRELLEGLPRLELLPARGVEVEGQVADGAVGQGLRRLRAGGEEGAPRGEAADAERGHHHQRGAGSDGLARSRTRAPRGRHRGTVAAVEDLGLAARCLGGSAVRVRRKAAHRGSDSSGAGGVEATRGSTSSYPFRLRGNQAGSCRSRRRDSAIPEVSR